jgi:hypothetical protein
MGFATEVLVINLACMKEATLHVLVRDIDDTVYTSSWHKPDLPDTMPRQQTKETVVILHFLKVHLPIRSVPKH